VRPAAVRRLVAFLAATVIAFLLTQEAAGRARPFSEAEAVDAESIAPVIQGDVHHAHQQALQAAFRLALAETVAGMAAAGRKAWSTDRPERYVRAYLVLEQTHRDLFYLLRLRVWVDRKLLRD
jgi:hypothetical protein